MPFSSIFTFWMGWGQGIQKLSHKSEVHKLNNLGIVTGVPQLASIGQSYQKLILYTKP